MVMISYDFCESTDFSWSSRSPLFTDMPLLRSSGGLYANSATDMPLLWSYEFVGIGVHAKDDNDQRCLCIKFCDGDVCLWFGFEWIFNRKGAAKKYAKKAQRLEALQFYQSRSRIFYDGDD